MNGKILRGFVVVGKNTNYKIDQFPYNDLVRISSHRNDDEELIDSLYLHKEDIEIFLDALEEINKGK